MNTKRISEPDATYQKLKQAQMAAAWQNKEREEKLAFSQESSYLLANLSVAVKPNL